MIIVKVEGVEELKAKLKKLAPEARLRFHQACYRAGLFLQRESQKIVPVDTGALKNSAFTRKQGVGSEDIVVVVGYTQHYAIYVHENLDARHAPGKTAKFLERPAQEHKDKLIAIMRAGVEGINL